jgi:hypothetical protein
MRWLELKEVSGDFTIEFFKANPYNLSSTMSGIDHVSTIEYWTVESTGPASAKVELSFDNVNSGGVTDMTSLRVAQLIVSWTNRGNTATTGSAGSAGSVTSNLISSFDINSRNFTLGSMVPNENPLPVKWLRLSVTRGQHQLEFRWTIPPNWQLREFILEGSNDGSHFNTLTKKDFDERFQTYNQLTPDDEERYMLFRIKAIERDGGIFFSNQVGVPGRDYISWRAHPVTSTELCIWILASKPTSLNVVLVNNYGQVLLNRKINVLAGSQQTLIGIPNLNPGSYQLIGFNEVLRAKVIRFMKK